LSRLVSTSNEADLDLADFVDYLADDEATRVIALYIESVRHPERFRAAALKAARAGKPVVAFKIGRSEAGARAAVSHTGALAGADRMYDALFRQTGVIRAQSFSDLLDIPAALATGRVLRGRRVAILTSTGGAGTLVSDSLGVAGFETPPPDEATAARLRALQSGDHAALDRNPIDVTLAGLRPELLRGAIRALLASPSYDALAIIVGASALAMPELMANAIRDCLPLSDKPVIAYVSPHAPEVQALLTRRGVPAFSAAESCTAALAGMLQSTRWKESVPQADAPRVDVGELPKGSLDEARAKQLFARFGVPCVRESGVETAAEAERAARELGGRVVLKILSGEITHKSDVGGVAVDVTPEQVGARLSAMAAEVETKAGVRPARFLVQEMVAGGTELILGMHRDPLGTAILLGMGGITAELFQDTTMRLLPSHGGLSRDEALSMARELRTWPLLDGFRGRPKADVDALVDAIVAFSRMAAQLGDRLLEAEINPVFVLPQGQGVRAADGVVVLR
jgi:acyl-CoA synthetase (NDP forming)